MNSIHSVIQPMCSQPGLLLQQLKVYAWLYVLSSHSYRNFVCQQLTHSWLMSSNFHLHETQPAISMNEICKAIIFSPSPVMLYVLSSWHSQHNHNLHWNISTSFKSKTLILSTSIKFDFMFWIGIWCFKFWHEIVSHEIPTHMQTLPCWTTCVCEQHYW